MQKLIDKIRDVRDIESAKSALYETVDEHSQIRDALEFAIEAHKPQKRKSGEPYVIHPILVASITSTVTKDTPTIISALLHDVVEDTEYSLDYIKERFGSDVAHLVDGVTKIANYRDQELAPSTSDEKLLKSALSFKKLVLASISDPRALIVKLCDRIHNLLTLDALPEKKQERIAEESLIVYAPIAHKLGISTVKNIIEDLSFKYLFRDEYIKIIEFMEQNEGSLQQKLSELKIEIETMLVKSGFPQDSIEVKGRIKHLYSIYLKMQRKGVAIDEVLDLLAIRVLVKDSLDAYKTLGLIHLSFQPINFRFKDYIATPKDNGYQTLHTTVFYKKAIFEIQVRTFEMDQTAEYGLAAHWKYKKFDKPMGVKTDWLYNLENKSCPIDDFRNFIKSDLYVDEVIVYSPKFDTFSLPNGATALDFAYSIHTDIGNRAKFAYINKERASLLTKLKNGDIVKIDTANSLIYRCSWIDSVKTQHSKKEMRNLCNHRLKDIDEQVGYNILRTVLKLNRRRVEKRLDSLSLLESVSKIPNQLPLLKNILNQYIGELKKNHRFLGFLKRHQFKLKTITKNSLQITSNRNISDIKFNYCCHPKSGDEVVGIIEGDDVYIHHKMCTTFLSELNDDKEMVFVDWELKENSKYKLIANISNERGALGNFLNYLAKQSFDLLSIKSERDSSSNDYTQYFELEMETKEKSIDKVRKQLEYKIKIIHLSNLNDSYKK